MNLKEAERKAFRLSTSQDGLYDTFFGLMIVLFSAMPWLDENGLRTPWNVILVESIGLLILLGVLVIKKYIVAPRIGHVRYGAERKKRMKRLAAGMGLIFVLTVALFGLTVRAIYFGEPLIDKPIQTNFPLDIVHTGAGIFIFAIFSLIGYMNDYPRLYVYGLLFGMGYIISTTLQDITGNPLYWPFTLAGLGAAVTGFVLFTCFLQSYPVPTESTLNEVN